MTFSHSPPPLSFRYPRGWAINRGPYTSSFRDLLISASNQALHDPCTTTVSPGHTEVDCGSPLDSLNQEGLLVEWWHNGFPYWSLIKQGGAPMTVDGRRAKLQGASPLCQGLLADGSLRVVIEEPAAPDNYYEFDACWRGSGSQRAVALAILDSVRLS